jgi:hypothetical protein
LVLTALSWGHSIEETAARLMEESGKARENGERYALMTAQNAAAAVERRQRNRALDIRPAVFTLGTKAQKEAARDDHYTATGK